MGQVSTATTPHELYLALLASTRYKTLLNIHYGSPQGLPSQYLWDIDKADSARTRPDPAPEHGIVRCGFDCKQHSSRTLLVEPG